eukprot:m.558366 g.558366  ORF g.558366 m.558366 type:complete len:683 (+) comp22199_c0_seq4:177-2225(+)
MPTRPVLTYMAVVLSPGLHVTMKSRQSQSYTLLSVLLCVVFDNILLSTAQIVSTVSPSVSSQCRLTGQAFEKYEKSSLVDRYAINKEFPTDFDDTSYVEEYSREAAIGSAALIIFALCMGCILCCYNCANCGAINDKVSGCCHPPKCFASGGWRKCAWMGLFATVVAGIVVLVIGFAQEEKESSAIRDVPTALGNYATFLETDVSDSIDCIKGQLDDILGNATDLLTRPGNAPDDVVDLNDIIFAMNNISDFITGSAGESLTEILTDAVDEIRRIEKDADDIADSAGDYNNAIVYSILGAAILCIAIGVIFSVSHGMSNGCKSHAKCMAFSCSCCAISILVLLLLIAAIYHLVVVFSAGFCDDPFRILAEADGQESGEKPSKTSFYLVCPTYNQEQTFDNWPWDEEQTDTAARFDESTSALRDLKARDPTGTRYTSLEASIDALGNTFIADDGVFGPLGFFSCQLVERFLQDIVINVCGDWYDPTAVLMECFVVLGVALISVQCLQTCLRRESQDTSEKAPLDDADEMEMQDSIGKASNVAYNSADSRQSNYSEPSGSMYPPVSDPSPVGVVEVSLTASTIVPTAPPGTPQRTYVPYQDPCVSTAASGLDSNRHSSTVSISAAGGADKTEPSFRRSPSGAVLPPSYADATQPSYTSQRSSHAANGEQARSPVRGYSVALSEV